MSILQKHIAGSAGSNQIPSIEELYRAYQRKMLGAKAGKTKGESTNFIRKNQESCSKMLSVLTDGTKKTGSISEMYDEHWHQVHGFLFGKS